MVRNTKQRTIRIPSELDNLIEDMADVRGFTFNAQVLNILWRFMESLENNCDCNDSSSMIADKRMLEYSANI